MQKDHHHQQKDHRRCTKGKRCTTCTKDVQKITADFPVNYQCTSRSKIKDKRYHY